MGVGETHCAIATRLAVSVYLPTVHDAECISPNGAKRMDSGPIWVLASFEPKPEGRDEVVRILDRMVEPTRQEAGCRTYDLFEGEGGAMHLLECYDDQTALEHHRRTEHYLAYRAAITDHLTSPIAVTVMSPRNVA